VSEHLLELIWQPAIERDLLNKLDDDGNLPLHAAAGNNQIEFCKKALDACKDPNDFLYIKNNHGQAAAHVATVAVHHRIGPERHYAERHHFYESKGQNRKTDAEEKDDDDDEDHDFGLPVLRLIWDNAKKGDKTSSLFKRDNNEQTCLHLAAAKGK
jgi:ankyrin repeat protein